MLDRYWFGEVRRISPGGAGAGRADHAHRGAAPGGAANVARNCAALGARTRLLSVVGARRGGRAARATARGRGRRGAAAHATPSVNTTEKLRVIGRQQQLLRIDFEKPPTREALAAKLADFDARARRVRRRDPFRLRQGRADAHHRMIEHRALGAASSCWSIPRATITRATAARACITPNLAEFREVAGTLEGREGAGAARRAELRARARPRCAARHAQRRRHDALTGRGTIARAGAAREVYDVSGAGDTVIADAGGDAGGGRGAAKRRCAWPTARPASWSASWALRVQRAHARELVRDLAHVLRRDRRGRLHRLQAS